MKRVEKGWGHELWIHNDHLYCGKLLYFNDGKRCSLHYHNLKTETFYVEQGTLECVFTTLEEIEEKGIDSIEKTYLTAGSIKEVPPGLVHSMKAIGGDVKLFEFSTQHFDEDSIRIVKGD